MKIGIITFHASHNYGSMLQAYALQTYLEGQGHHVEIVNYRSLSQKKMYSKPLSCGSKTQVKQTIKQLLLEPSTIKPLYKKWHLFEDFLSQHLHLTKECNTLEELRNAKFDYDYIITGSDQIWNTDIMDFSEAYFANFVDERTKKIAYAASLGPNPEMCNKTMIKEGLKSFSMVSVREQRSQSFLEKNGLYRPVYVMIDPTMLLNIEQYEKLYSKRPLIKGKYVYYYTPGGVRPEFMEAAKEIGSLYKLPVVTDCAHPFYQMQGFRDFHLVREVGPSEFLNLIKNATVVCGASFHLMVFSILFKKNFYCLGGDVDSRMNNLMKIMHMEERIVSVNVKNKIRIFNEKYDVSPLIALREVAFRFLSLKE